MPLILFLMFLASGLFLYSGSAQQQQAQEAYQDQRYAESYQLFKKAASKNSASSRYRLRFAEGSAAYQQKKYPQALRAYSEALHEGEPHFQEQVHYNIGCALTAQGEHLLGVAPFDQASFPLKKSHLIPQALACWQDALIHYDDALRINPKNLQAKENQALLKKWIQMLKKEQEKKNKQQQSNSPKKNTEKNKNASQNKQKQDSSGKNSSQNPSSGSSSSGQKNTDQEKQLPPQPRKEQGHPQQAQSQDKSPPQSSPHDNKQASTQKEESSQKPLTPMRPGESPEEHARRVLSKYADLGQQRQQQDRAASFFLPRSNDW